MGGSAILVIGAADLAGIEEAVLAAYPREACGLLIGVERAAELRVAQVVPAPNVTPGDAHERFEIDPALLVQVHRSLRGTPQTLLGHYHSHPDGPAFPSRTDLAHAFTPGLAWLIFGIDRAGAISRAAFRHPEGEESPAEFEPLLLRIEP